MLQQWFFKLEAVWRQTIGLNFCYALPPARVVRTREQFAAASTSTGSWFAMAPARPSFLQVALLITTAGEESSIASVAEHHVGLSDHCG